MEGLESWLQSMNSPLCGNQVPLLFQFIQNLLAFLNGLLIELCKVCACLEGFVETFLPCVAKSANGLGVYCIVDVSHFEGLVGLRRDFING